MRIEGGSIEGDFEAQAQHVIAQEREDPVRAIGRGRAIGAAVAHLERGQLGNVLGEGIETARIDADVLDLRFVPALRGGAVLPGHGLDVAVRQDRGLDRAAFRARRDRDVETAVEIVAELRRLAAGDEAAAGQVRDDEQRARAHQRRVRTQCYDRARG